MAITIARGVLTRGDLKRGALAKRLGCNVETIRYYENIAIMPSPLRDQNGHRVYTEQDQERLQFILRCRELGFTIRDITRLLSMVDTNSYTCGDIHSLTQEYLKSVTEKISDLRRLKKSLKSISENCADDASLDCPIIDALREVKVS